MEIHREVPGLPTHVWIVDWSLNHGMVGKATLAFPTEKGAVAFAEKQMLNFSGGAKWKRVETNNAEDEIGFIVGRWDWQKLHGDGARRNESPDGICMVIRIPLVG